MPATGTHTEPADPAHQQEQEQQQLALALDKVGQWLADPRGSAPPILAVLRLAVTCVRRAAHSDQGAHGQIDLDGPPPPHAPPVLAHLSLILARLLLPQPGATPQHTHTLTHHLLPALLPELIPLAPVLSPRAQGVLIDHFEKLHLLLPLVPGWEQNIARLAEAFFTSPSASHAITTPTPQSQSQSSPPTCPTPRVRAAKLLLSTTFHALLDLPSYLARLLAVLLPGVLRSVAAEEDQEVWQLELAFLQEALVLLVGEEEEAREELELELAKGALRREERERSREDRRRRRGRERQRRRDEEMIGVMERPDGVDLEAEAERDQGVQPVEVESAEEDGEEDDDGGGGGDDDEEDDEGQEENQEEDQDEQAGVRPGPEDAQEDEPEEEEDEATPTLTGAPVHKATLPAPSSTSALTPPSDPSGPAPPPHSPSTDRLARILSIRQCLREVGAAPCPDAAPPPPASSASDTPADAALPGAGVGLGMGIGIGIGIGGTGAGAGAGALQTPSKTRGPRPPFMGLISNVLAGNRSASASSSSSTSASASTSTAAGPPAWEDPTSGSGSPTPAASAPASGLISAARSPLTSALPSPARGVLGSASAALLGGLSVPPSPVVPSSPAVGESVSPLGTPGGATSSPAAAAPGASAGASESTAPVPPRARHAAYCKSKQSVLVLIALFTQLAFSPPHTLRTLTRSPRAPASAHSLEVFRDLLDLLQSRSTCQRARLTALQWLMRLRADRDHRLFLRRDIDGEVLPFAALIGRTEESRRALEASAENEDLAGVAGVVPPTPDLPAQEDRERSRNRSGREERGSRSTSVERSRGSRSRSRQPGADRRPRELAPAAPAQPIWSLPEELPFPLEIGTRPSEGMTTYELGIISRMEDADPHEAEAIASTVRHWLPVSVYLSTLISLLRSETDWELVSYILVHFTAQLANKHLFCGPKLRKIIPDLVGAVTQSVGATSQIDRIAKPKGIKNTDVHGLIYNLVGILIGYKGTLERKEQDAIVDVLQEGLTRDSATAKPCLQALAIACFELPLSMTRSLPKILPKLTQIMSASATSVHIIELICVIGSLPELYSNFTREDYQRVFGVAVQYIQYHNSAQATETGFSYSLSQHILQLAYYSIYVWFLSIPLLERPKHIPYIARGLQLATQNKGGMDEQTEVCFDWLARYTWANADPKPHKSFLSEVIMRPTNEPDTQIEEKHYLQGHSIITIRTVTKRGWSEIISQRPSGTTQIICKLENVPTTGPGEFAPDPVTAQALVMADRDMNVVSKPLPNEPITLEDGTVIYRHTEDQTAKAHKEALDLFGWTPRGSDGGMRPLDAMTGYVWVGSAPSQRRKPVSVHPSFLPVVVGPFPGAPTPSNAFMPLPASEVVARTLRFMNATAVIDVHKVGILYVGPGQTTEAEILSNQNGSPGYTSFLVNMGRLIRLKGQRDIYSGGLDLENDLDGEYAYAWWDDIAQVIYHAATLMPNYPHDTQFNFKKRHIGNDNIRIVWNDSGMPYKFDTLRTEFQFVNIVIEPHSVGSLAVYSLGSHSDEYYKLTMQRAPGMPEFGPTGTVKIVSARNLPSVVRQISLLADFFTTIWTFTAGDNRRDEWVSSWRGRLQAIKRLQAHVRSTQQAETTGGAPAEMDFSLAY